MPSKVILNVSISHYVDDASIEDNGELRKQMQKINISKNKERLDIKIMRVSKDAVTWQLEFRKTQSQKSTRMVINQSEFFPIQFFDSLAPHGVIFTENGIDQLASFLMDLMPASVMMKSTYIDFTYYYNRLAGLRELVELIHDMELVMKSKAGRVLHVPANVLKASRMIRAFFYLSSYIICTILKNLFVEKMMSSHCIVRRFSVISRFRVIVTEGRTSDADKIELSLIEYCWTIPCFGQLVRLKSVKVSSIVRQGLKVRSLRGTAHCFVTAEFGSAIQNTAHPSAEASYTKACVLSKNFYIFILDPKVAVRDAPYLSETLDFTNDSPRQMPDGDIMDL
ncbi:hypothetical protein EAG_02331 [Camponotus floridanus]|uniref:Uncharacterized protein n=1 Tax=Camponotus floridanus TaxID=104421 RepID=E2A4J0_CAMFO|nr:hypothetical protein EAG_02331 [Camponotus floridanus]